MFLFRKKFKSPFYIKIKKDDQRAGAPYNSFSSLVDFHKQRDSINNQFENHTIFEIYFKRKKSLENELDILLN